MNKFFSKWNVMSLRKKYDVSVDGLLEQAVGMVSLVSAF